MKPYGPYVAARTLFESAVRTMRGMDRLTGMPVLIYTLPRPADVPQLMHRRLVPYTDAGSEQGVPFVVAELPLHAVPAGDPLLAARGALEALVELHSDGRIHGGLTPAQLWAVDGDVRLAGACLPWEALGAGFDAPEGGKSPQADLYALGCSLEAMGGVPDALRVLLDADPRGRPSAREALGLLSRPYQSPARSAPRADDPPPTPEHAAPPAAPEPEAPTLQPDAVSELLSLFDEPVAPQAVTPPAGAEPVLIGEVSPEPPARAPAVPDPTPAVAAPVFPPIRMGFEDVAPPPAPFTVRVVPAPPAPGPSVQAPTPGEDGGLAPVNPRQQPIRIGWEEDNSWRVVRSPDEETRPAAPARAPTRTWALGAVIALVLLSGLLWWRLGSTPTSVGTECCQVDFRVTGGQDKVNISVLKAPGGSGLKRGDLIGAVPGVLQFPDARGAYTLQAEADGYATMQFQVTVPSRAPVEIDLKR